MKNLHFRVLTMLIGLYFTGTMTDPSRKSSILFNSECQWTGHLLTNCSSTEKHDIRVDKPQFVPVDASASSLRDLLQSRVRKEDWNIKHLDLSNNCISNITLSPLARFHALEILNLSNSSIRSISLDLPSAKSSWGKRHRSSHTRGLPFLKLLILQRNKLTDIPKGLWKLKSLQSLDLSFNEIAQIGMSDLQNCLWLENLYLKSNKIFSIHPEAFKDLKKLQVVDLSNNVLTAVLPMMVIALELPHLEVDLADNQWQCDSSVAAFQNVISESWRKTWNVICSKSVGDEEAYRWTLQSRISRETHLPHAPAKPVKSLPPGQAERPQAGLFEHPDTPQRKGPRGTQASGRPRRLPRWARSPSDGSVAGRSGDPSQDLALAVCLAVFITFFLAFCLGAFTRPFIDRLWQQRCRRKGPSSDHTDNAENTYWNEAFCGDSEAARNAQRQRTDRPLQEPTGHQAVVIPDGPLGGGRREPGHWWSVEPGSHSRGPGGGKGDILLSDRAAHSAPPGQPNADPSQRIPAGQSHIHKKDGLGEVNYATLAQEGSPSIPPWGALELAGRLHTVSGSIHRDSSELNAPLSRGLAASRSKMQKHMEAQRAGENEQLPSEFSTETQVGTYLNLLDTQQQRLQGARTEEKPPASHSAVPLRDPGELSPASPVFPPRWGRDPQVTPPNVEQVQKQAPSGPRYMMDSNYDSDSDEGSLFTLSSTSSEDARNAPEEEAHGKESHRTSDPLEDEDPGVRKEYVTSLEDSEDNIPCQKILERCENQKDYFQKPLISGPDSGLCANPLEGAANTDILAGPLTLPGPLLSNSPSREEIPGTILCECATALQPERVEWHYSLRDLEFSNVDVVPQTEMLYHKNSNSPSPDEIPDTVLCESATALRPEEVEWHYSLRDLEFSNVDIVPQTEMLYHKNSNSPSRDETPDTVLCESATALRPEGVEWHYSLRDLEFSNVDIVPQTEMLYHKNSNSSSCDKTPDTVLCESATALQPEGVEWHYSLRDLEFSNVDVVPQTEMLYHKNSNSPTHEEIPGSVLCECATALRPEGVEWHYSLRDLEFSNVDIVPQTEMLYHKNSNSPSRDETPDTVLCESATALQPEGVEWHYSLRDLEFSNVDVVPQTEMLYHKNSNSSSCDKTPDTVLCESATALQPEGVEWHYSLRDLEFSNVDFVPQTEMLYHKNSNSPSRDETPDTVLCESATALQPEGVEWHYSLRDLEFSNVDVVPQTEMLYHKNSNSPSHEEIPGSVLCECATALQPEGIEWHYSLRDLEFLNVDVVQQTPPWSAEGPSDPDKSDYHEGDLDIYTYEPCLQEINTVQHDIPLKISAGENLRPSQQNSEGDNRNSHPRGTDANGGLACPIEDSNSRKVRSRTQLLPSTLQSGSRERGCAENRPRSQELLLQELPHETSSPGTQGPLGDREWGKYSEENLLQLQRDHVHVYIQRRTQGHLLRAGHLYKDLLYYDANLTIKGNSSNV